MGSLIHTFTSTSTQTVGEGQRQILDVLYVKITLAINSVLLTSMQILRTLKIKKTNKQENAHYEVNTLFIRESSDSANFFLWCN